MRDRREFIKVGGSTLALGVAGCVHRVPEEEPVSDDGEGEEDGSESDDGSEDEPTGNESTDDGSMDGEDEGQEEDGEEEEPQPASFTVVNTTAPSTTEIGLEFNWSFTVENEGESEGTFTTTVSRRKDEGIWNEVADVELTVSPGEELTHVDSDSLDFVGTYDYRVDEVNRRFTVEANDRELNFEEFYTNPDGVIMAVQDRGVSRPVEVTKGYTYNQGEDRAIERASEGKQFVLVEVDVQNPAREVIELPRREEFIISVGGEDYETVEYLGENAYVGGESRTQRSGVLAFEISDRHRPGSTFDVFWVRRYPRGRAAAVWSTTNE